MSPAVALIIGFVLALAGTIALYILVLPKKKDGTLQPFLQFLHNYFHFKQLYIEIVLKFCFTLSTLLCIFGGFFMLFASVSYYGYTQSYALYGLILMVAGPIVMRLFYEMSMMFILLVQNVIDINKKIKGDAKTARGPEPSFESSIENAFQMPYQAAAPQAAPQPIPQPAAPQPAAPQPAADRQFCPNCGTRIEGGQPFCPNCGNRMVP